MQPRVMYSQQLSHAVLASEAKLCAVESRQPSTAKMQEPSRRTSAIESQLSASCEVQPNT